MRRTSLVILSAAASSGLASHPLRWCFTYVVLTAVGVMLLVAAKSKA